MFVEERHAEILSMLEENEKVYVKELSDRFGVTQDCIRKDLAILEGQSLLKRTYGGAVKPKVVIHETNVARRKDKNVKEKQIIAKKAVSLIDPGDVVFLDISTTNIEVAKELIRSRKKVTVVTNMLDIANIFANTTELNVEFILIGGTFNRGQDGFQGGLTVDMMKKFSFDKSFVGIVGGNIDTLSLTTYAVEDGICKECIIQTSKKSYVVMETMKFELEANYRFGTFVELEGVICEKSPTKKIKEKLKEIGVTII